MKMLQPTPELEVILGVLVYSECRIDAIVSILKQKGITVSSEEIENITQSFYQSEYEKKRSRILSTIETSRSI